MNSETWFILDRGKVAGPFSLDQISAHRSQGAFTSFARVSQDRASWVPVDQQMADIRARGNAPAPVRPPVRSGIPGVGVQPVEGTPAQREYRVSQAEIIHPFPLVALLLLHYLAGSIYTFFWITRMHGLIPKMKTDDPSATKAICLCFVPFFNIYWIVNVYVRLARRVNALSAAYRLPRSVPVALAYAMGIMIVIPLIMFTAGGILLVLEAFSDAPVNDIIWLFFRIPYAFVALDLTFIVPIYAVYVQRSMNQIAYAQLELLLQQ